MEPTRHETVEQRAAADRARELEQLAEALTPYLGFRPDGGYLLLAYGILKLMGREGRHGA